MSFTARLASRSAMMFGLRILGAGLTFLVQAAIARTWGAKPLADYLLVVATANLLAVALPLGFQTVGNYFAAAYASSGEGRQLRRFVVRAYAHVLVVGLLVVLFGQPLTGWMGMAGDRLEPLWIPTALLAVATGTIFLNSAILIGLKRPLAGFLADMIFRPVLAISAFAVIAALSEGPDMAGMLWAFSLAFLGLVAVHFLFVLHAVRKVPLEAVRRTGEERRWWRFAAPWVLITLASDFFFDINLLLLADLMTRTELAVFGVATRIFSLVSFGVVAVYALTLPELFDADAKGGRSALAEKLGDANVVATLLAVGLFAAVALGGGLVLMLFGDSFGVGAAPMAVLCLSLVVRAMFGPAALVLSINDKPYASLPSVGLGLLVLVAGNLVLVPAHGLMGAAVSVLVAITVWSASLWLTAWLRLGLDVSVLARLRRGKPLPVQ